ncbi:MAG: hypothetical protein GY768_16905 [Planctomycetaceae bacterium]|nr:hypothetical protein [Planctomycetaceae bacterium]
MKIHHFLLMAIAASLTLQFHSTSSRATESRGGANVHKGTERDLLPWQEVGEPLAPARWTGLTQTRQGGILPLPGHTEYQYDKPADWSKFDGLRIELTLPPERLVKLTIEISTPPLKASGGYRSSNATTRAAFTVQGSGQQVINLPFSAFDHHHAFSDTFQKVHKVVLRGHFEDGESGNVSLRRVRLAHTNPLKLYTAIRSRAAEPKGQVEYLLNVMNCSDSKQSVSLTHSRYSKHVMTGKIDPANLQLDAGETKSCKVIVNVTDRVPPGGRERQKIVALANGSLGGEIEFITACRLAHPYLVHTPKRWREIHHKIQKYPWAKAELKRYTEHQPKDNSPQQHWPLGIAWQLTRDPSYAQRAKHAITANAKGKQLIQSVELYDMIQDSGVFSTAEEETIRKAFRTRMETIDLSGVANLELQQARCGFTLALALQDFAWLDYFYRGTDGVYDNIANGILPDGWWYEGSVNYNIWVSQYICKMALAAEPFGINLVDQFFAPGYSKEFRQLPENVELRKREHGGKPFQKFGKHTEPRITLDRLWDSFLPHLAHDGTMVAANDGVEVVFSQSDAYELAYMMYGKPEYASVIKRAPGRSLLYGVGELPETTPPIGIESAFSDGIGLTTLRSKTAGRHPRDQISATLKYGTHGAYHGHFDRTAFNSLMRHDRSFYNGHSLWFGYSSFMYGFYVQSTANHNLVIVDSRNQEAVESERLLFHSGSAMQAAVVQTNARWCNPPYMGLSLRNPTAAKNDPPVYTGPQRARAEDIYMPLPNPVPTPASIGEFSEPVLQRRLMVVTDDYVVLADYLQGQAVHTFDNLIHIRGFEGIRGDIQLPPRHTDQMSTNPLLAPQLITDCSWYRKTGTSRANFCTVFDGHSSQFWGYLHGKEGNLLMDVFSAWPIDNEVMIATAPVGKGRAGLTHYQITLDDKLLAEQKFSPWILGREEMSLPIQRGSVLRLATTNSDGRGKGHFPTQKLNSLFWANGSIETADGQRIPLSKLESMGRLTYDGILRTTDTGNPLTPGTDFFGGEVKIQGRLYQETISAQPQGNGVITIDLKSLNAKTLHVTIGADYPYGTEKLKEHRYVHGSRVKGRWARFLTVIEAYQDSTRVKHVKASSANQLKVQLADGTEQELLIQGFEGNGSNIAITLTESKDGKLIRTESTSP